MNAMRKDIELWSRRHSPPCKGHQYTPPILHAKPQKILKFRMPECRIRSLWNRAVGAPALDITPAPVSNMALGCHAAPSLRLLARRGDLFLSTEQRSAATRVVVASTVALAFISFWRGAAIVLSDLASSAFYAGGIAEQAIGKAAPWFVLGVMLFSFAVRSVYMESCSMFVRGGVYVVVRDSMGPVLAKVSVSALVFDYILTGPISVVSAGQYLGALLNEISELLHQSYRVNQNTFAAGMAVMATIYFWWANIKGVHESSSKALRIMQITTVMVVILMVWCPLTIALRGQLGNLPPAPVASNLTFVPDAQGWLAGTFWLQIPVVAIIVAFGHSLLSM